MTRVEKATQFVATAQADLDAALASGTDTSEARERLRLAEQELQDAKAAQAQAEFSNQGEARDRHQRMVEAELKAVTDTVNASLAELASITPPTVTLPAGPLDNLIRARQQLEEAKDAMATHQTKVDELNGRLQALISERQAITDRRAGGNRNDAKDGPRLALLNADIDGLQGLIERTRAEAPQDINSLATELSRLAAAWGNAQQEAVSTALNAHCHVLEDALIEAANRLKSRFPVGFVGLRYRPSERLKHACASGVV
jgi:hypothetical protein